MAERWKAIVGFEHRYEVSDLGRIRSHVSGKVLTAVKTRGGYLTVGLYHSDGVNKTSKRVNVLVLSAFDPPRPAGLEAAHENGNRQDNRRVNLAWKTHAANQKDKVAHGTQPRGSVCYQAVLTEAAVKRIRKRHVAGDSFAQIARDLGLKYQCVYDAGTGRRWPHVG